jgi:hypothetical protein
MEYSGKTISHKTVTSEFRFREFEFSIHEIFLSQNNYTPATPDRTTRRLKNFNRFAISLELSSKLVLASY